MILSHQPMRRRRGGPRELCSGPPTTALAATAPIAVLPAARHRQVELLQAVIWLQDVRTVVEFNKVWYAWVAAGSTPPERRHRGAAAVAREDDRDHGNGGEVIALLREL